MAGKKKKIVLPKEKVDFEKQFDTLRASMKGTRVDAKKEQTKASPVTVEEMLSMVEYMGKKLEEYEGIKVVGQAIYPDDNNGTRPFPGGAIVVQGLPKQGRAKKFKYARPGSQ